VIGHRTLDPELTADGWRALGHDGDMFWVHGPSNRSVNLESLKRCQVTGDGFGSDPGEPGDDGWVVMVHEHDEHGNPDAVRWKMVWLRSYDVAFRRARSIRASIVADKATVEMVEQGELFAEGTTTKMQVEQ
jgi:hypothetical protein